MTASTQTYSEAGVIHLLDGAIELFEAESLCEVDTCWLPCGSLRQVRHSDHDLGAPLILKHLSTHEPLAEVEALELLARLQHCDNADALAEHGMGHGKAEHILDIGVFPDGVLYLERGDLLARAIDELLETAYQVEVSILIHPALVPAPHEAVSKGLLIRVFVHVWPHLVALHDTCALDTDLTFLSRLHPRVLRITSHDHQFRSHRGPYRLELADSITRVRAEWVGLCHGVSWQHCALDELFHLHGKARNQGGRVVPDEPDFVVIREVRLFGFVELLGHVHERQVVHRHCGVGCGERLLDAVLIEDVGLVQARQRNEPRAAEGGCQEILHQTSNVEHGHGVDEYIVGCHQIRGGVALASDRHALMRDWHDLGLLGGARGVQDKANVIALHSFQRGPKLCSGERLAGGVPLE
mmetsp:Transcript_127365/g.271538  ORF Transcript_127365/g.271538 Transcript_127365/m.271538 type:complete len:411 (+) Transcript_127365:27-1259(+)